MNNSLSSLVPLNQIPFGAVQESPLMALTRVEPRLGYDLIIREQGLRERSVVSEERLVELDLLKTVSGNQAGQICQWLGNRQPHETSATAN